MSGISAKLKIVVATGLLSMALIRSSSAEGGPIGPRIKCTPEEFNFGFVPQGATVSHTFWLRNTGTEQVTIKQLKPNCGCTQVPPTDSTIAVGDSLPAEILFSSRNITGKVEKYIRIVSNAQGRVPALAFEAHIFKEEGEHGPITPSPAIVKLSGTTSVAKVTLKNGSKSVVRAQVVDLPPSLFKLDNEELSLAPEDSKELTIMLLPKGTMAEFRKSITLETNSPAKTRLTIPITNVQKE